MENERKAGDQGRALNQMIQQAMDRVMAGVGANLKFYLVGGCVRDLLLGRQPKDFDWVVVGETPESMLALGFQQVGQQFPVFLHPETREEFALARSERMTEDGGFEYVWEGVTLEEDLTRRDLTINSMAMSPEGEVIDPHGGFNDLIFGLLHHTSLQFSQDPLRVLRVARFAAAYDFKVAPYTNEVMAEIVQSGALANIPDSRIWGEVKKAMLTDRPDLFFAALDQCGALATLMPEIKAMQGIVQRADYHAEGDVYVHTMMVLKESVNLTRGLEPDRALRVRLGALLHDIGKPLTPPEFLYNEDGSVLGKHPQHDNPARFGNAFKALTQRLGMPHRIAGFAYKCASEHQKIHNIRKMSGKGLVNLYDKLKLRHELVENDYALEDYALVCTADAFGALLTLGDGSIVRRAEYPQAAYFRDKMLAINEFPVGEWFKASFDRHQNKDRAVDEVLAKRRKAASALLAPADKVAAPQEEDFTPSL